MYRLGLYITSGHPAVAFFQSTKLVDEERIKQTLPGGRSEQQTI
jgi:hypothetical protein